MNRYYILFFVLFFSTKISFSQTNSEGNELTKNIVSSQVVDYNKTVNPNLDLSGNEEEVVTKTLIPINEVILNTTVADVTDADTEIIEKTIESFDQVINPRSEK